MNHPTLALIAITINITLVACNPAGPTCIDDDVSEIVAIGPRDPAAALRCDWFVVDVLVQTQSGWESLTVDAGSGAPGDVLQVRKSPDVWNLACIDGGQRTPWYGQRLNRSLAGSVSQLSGADVDVAPVPEPEPMPELPAAVQLDSYVITGPIDPTNPAECDWMSADVWPAGAPSVIQEDIEATRPGDLISLPTGSQLVGVTCGWSTSDGLGHEAPWSATRIE